MKHVPSQPSVPVDEIEPVSAHRVVEGLKRCRQSKDEHGVTTYLARDRDISFIEPLLRAGIDEIGLAYNRQQGIVQLSKEAVAMLKPFGLSEALGPEDIDELEQIAMEAQPEMAGRGWSARAGIGTRQPLASWMEEIRNRPSERASSGIRHSER